MRTHQKIILSVTAARGPDPVDLRIGATLRLLRRQKDLSLQSVAATSGLSVGYLSQLERGLSSGTVRDLLRVADTLGTDLASLLGRNGAADSSRSPYIVRAAEREKIGFSDGVLKDILTPRVDGVLRVYMVRLDPHGSSGPDTYTHSGEEAGLVLQGRLLLTIDGVDHLLNEGDSFGFPSSTPHRFANPAETPSRVIWVNSGTPPGQTTQAPQ